MPAKVKHTSTLHYILVLDLGLPITTEAVNLNLDHDEVYSIQHYAIDDFP